MPSEIASWPLAESTSTFGMKYGEMRSGPRSRSVSACSTIPISPPIAEPKTIPTRCGSKPFRPESASASFAAPSASTTLRSSRRSSFGCASPAGSKSLTSAAMRTGSPSASKARMKSIPLSPATAARQVSGAVFPTGVTAPRPVTTTRRTVRNLRGDACLPERELGELVPVGLDLLRHRLFVLAVLARRPRRFPRPRPPGRRARGAGSSRSRGARSRSRRGRSGRPSRSGPCRRRPSSARS